MRNIKFIKKHSIEIWVLMISIVSFIIMICTSGYASLWYDEIAQIGFIYNGSNVLDIIMPNLTTIDNTPPLFALIAAIWIRIVPYGEAWLRLLPEIFTTCGIFVVGKCGSDMFDKKTAIIVTIMVSTSANLVFEAGHQFRAYGLLFFTAALVMHAYFKLQKDGLSIKHIIMYAISMVLSVYSHYFGVVLCFSLFLYDAILYLKKERTIKFMIPYIITGIIYLPWVIAVFYTTKGNMMAWPAVPNLGSIMGLILFLSDNSKLIMFLFLYGIMASIYSVVSKDQKNKNLIYEKSFQFRVLSFVIISNIVIVYVYSRYLAGFGSFFYNRYFISLVPFFYMLCAISLTHLLDTFGWLSDKKREVVSRLAVCSIAIIGFMTLGTNSYDRRFGYYQPYREAAEYIMSRGDVSNEDTLVIASSCYGKGWNYYLLKDGAAPINVKDKQSIVRDEIQNYNTIYLFQVHILADEEQISLLYEMFNEVERNNELNIIKFQKK